MDARASQSGARLAVRRGDVVACITTERARPEQVTRTLESLSATIEGVPVLVLGAGAPPAGDAAPVPGVKALPEAPEGPAGLAAAAAAAAPADIVVIPAGLRLSGEWLARLRGIAATGSDVATVSAIPLTSLDPGGEVDLAAAAERLAASPPGPPTRLSAPVGGCVLIRRSAIELVGAPGGGDFADACLRHGLSHRLAGNVLVDDRDLAGARAWLAAGCAGGQGLARPTVDPAGPLRHGLGRARRTIAGMSVAIDARELARSPDGTRVHLAGVIGAVARSGACRVTAIVDGALDADTRVRLEAIPGLTVARLDHRGGLPAGSRADVVHRPHQVSTPADLAVLAGLGERLVITQQDLIGFHQAGYFASPDSWRAYRGLTQRSLAAADRVVFFSRHVREDALAEGLLEPSRADVVPIGVDHRTLTSAGAPRRPAGPAELEAGEMLLCLGTDLVHKNRVFALSLAGELRRRHGWAGHLVLAGTHVAHGSSRVQEHALLAREPELAATVVDLGPVDEPEKEWLLDHACLVLYPTLHEGFGLVPYEAAAHDVPCLWAPGTALTELLPDEAAALVPWDAAASAEKAITLMRDPAARAELVSAVAARGAALTWERTGAQLLDIYRRACEEPANPAGALERTGGLMDAGLSEDAVRLVGPGGALPAELERPLLALATHPRIGAPVFAALRAGYRLTGRRRG